MIPAFVCNMVFIVEYNPRNVQGFCLSVNKHENITLDIRYYKSNVFNAPSYDRDLYYDACSVFLKIRYSNYLSI